MAMAMGKLSGLGGSGGGSSHASENPQDKIVSIFIFRFWYCAKAYLGVIGCIGHVTSREIIRQEERGRWGWKSSCES